MTTLNRALEGARNLLLNCAGVQPGDSLLILHEDPSLGWYDHETPMLVARVARDLGASVELRQTGGPENRFLDEAVDKGDLIEGDCDCCIFFARIGDQLRFAQAPAGRKHVMCYAASIDALASDYGRVEYQAMADLKTAIDTLLLKAGSITISCPLGSDLRGDMRDHATGAPGEVTVLRFPVGVHVPIDARSFSGEVRLARYLTPTGSRVYDPPWISIDEPVTAVVESGHVIRFVGDGRDIDRVERQYRQVAQEFSIEPDVVHSWHAGIHPGCHFAGLAADDPDRWSNTVFTNPRFVHFHTCGNDAPGEICWMVLDPTICIDGIALWEDGKLQLEQFAETRLCLERWPRLSTLFDEGNGAVGLSR